MVGDTFIIYCDHEAMEKPCIDVLVSCCFEASMNVSSNVNHRCTKNLKAQPGESKSCLLLAALARE